VIDKDKDKREGRSQITGKDMGRVIVLGMAGPVILSAVGPFYYGYTHAPYWRIIVWALTCTVGFLWLERASFKHSLGTASPSIIGTLLLICGVPVIAATAFIVGDSLVYLLAGLL
jgi:hypothetical protein